MKILEYLFKNHNFNFVKNIKLSNGNLSLYNKLFFI